tara:strand:+ start:31082 stop:31534 length:453 start_codon:yes stop_codon:yes gene_type:complete
MFKVISKLNNRKVSSKGLGVFRIAFFLNLFLEVLHRFQFRHLYYIPYLQSSILSKNIIWSVWFFVLVMLIIGFKTRILTIVNCIFVLAFIVNNRLFQDHMNYAYVGMGFLMMLLPVSKSYSIDNLILRIKYSSKKKLFIPDQLTSGFFYC